MRKKTNEEAIMDFIKVHGKNKYDYSLVDYTNAVTKVNILCKKHGMFSITPNSHKNGSGCNLCGREITVESRKKTNEEFIRDSKKIHGDIYDYSKTEYNGNLSYVKIICKKHGVFSQQARKHLMGNKCKKCSSESYYVDFVKRCKKKFPQYDYSKVDYKGMYNDVIIICKKHGEFITKPTSFYHKERGCKKCINYNKSKQETKWLNSLKIPKENRNVYISFGKKTYCVDAYDKKNKTIYEYYGDFFHGNPDVYNLEDINPLLKETYKNLYKKTKEKENTIKKYGYKLITIWENDFKNKNKNK